MCYEELRGEETADVAVDEAARLVHPELQRYQLEKKARYVYWCCVIKCYVCVTVYTW
jgi:hypothetical protein